MEITKEEYEKLLSDRTALELRLILFNCSLAAVTSTLFDFITEIAPEKEVEMHKKYGSMIKDLFTKKMAESDLPLEKFELYLKMLGKMDTEE